MNNFGQGFFAPARRFLHSLRTMNTIARPSSFRAPGPTRALPPKEQFRERFQRSLQSCLRRGFRIEESFGLIWTETWEEVPLPEPEREKLYDEMICWAKRCVREGVFPSCSQQLFTGFSQARNDCAKKSA